MKKILYISATFFLSLLALSCDNYFDVDLKQNVDTANTYKTVYDVESGLNGAYNALGHYAFYGRDLVALGDIATDNAKANTGSGHFVAVWQYTIDETTGDLSDIWTGGYWVLDRTTRTINGAKALIASSSNLSAYDVDLLNSYIAQCYALRALASHALVCVFGLPYGTDTNPHGGIVLIDQKPIETGEKVSRSSVDATYTQILKDIQSAKDVFALTSVERDQFYMAPASVYALEARVRLHMHMYPEAAAAAQEAIDLRASKDVDNIDYIRIWKSISISDEDIYTIAKSPQDNLSANALNTLYGSYGCMMNPDFSALFGTKDIRKALLSISVDPRTGAVSSVRPLKFNGIPTSQAVNNIPVFRKSEMYLILAEAYAQQNLITDAQNALFYTAKRDMDITSIADLPATQTDLLTFISQERRRELFQEGFRWYDARRTGEIISVYSGKYTNYDVSKFVYPIPSSEINSGFGTEQNDNWYENLPE